MRKREFAQFDENRRAGGNAEPVRDTNKGMCRGDPWPLLVQQAAEGKKKEKKLPRGELESKNPGGGK